MPGVGSASPSSPLFPLQWRREPEWILFFIKYIMLIKKSYQTLGVVGYCLGCRSGSREFLGHGPSHLYAFCVFSTPYGIVEGPPKPQNLYSALDIGVQAGHRPLGQHMRPLICPGPCCSIRGQGL